MSEPFYQWLADENFPVPSYKLLADAGWDIQHIGLTEPGIPDTQVMDRAVQEARILLTFDNDHGTLVFRFGHLPPGVVHFRLIDYTPEFPGQFLRQMVSDGWKFHRLFTVVDENGIRQRSI